MRSVCVARGSPASIRAGMMTGLACGRVAFVRAAGADRRRTAAGAGALRNGVPSDPQQFEDGTQPPLHGGQSFASRIPPDELFHGHRRFRGDRGGFVLELPPRSGQGQPLDKKQVPNSRDLLNVLRR